MARFKDKRAVVTGGTRGIGLAIATSLISEGARVVAVSRTEQLDGSVERFEHFQADVTNADDIRQLKAYVAALGGVDFLIHSAGITDSRPFASLPEAAWLNVIAVNLSGVMRVTQALLPSVRKSSQGRIISIGSVAGMRANVGQAVYGASKAGLIHFMKVLALEEARKGITCNVICPGFIDTDMTESLREAIKEKALAQIPQHRFGKPENVASLVLWLCSKEAAYVTGAVFAIDGGLSVA